MESKTFLCSSNKRQSVPDKKEGIASRLGNWISPEDMNEAVNERFPGCMNGIESIMEFWWVLMKIF